LHASRVSGLRVSGRHRHGRNCPWAPTPDRPRRREAAPLTAYRELHVEWRGEGNPRGAAPGRAGELWVGGRGGSETPSVLGLSAVGPWPGSWWSHAPASRALYARQHRVTEHPEAGESRRRPPGARRRTERLDLTPPPSQTLPGQGSAAIGRG